jgi:hypothetical protein
LDVDEHEQKWSRNKQNNEDRKENNQDLEQTNQEQQRRNHNEIVNNSNNHRNNPYNSNDWLFVSYVVLLDDVQFISSFAVYDFVSSKFTIFRFSVLIVFSYSAFSNSRFLMYDSSLTVLSLLSCNAFSRK